MPELTLFVGPTAHGMNSTALAGQGVRMQPPAGRGDIARLVHAASAPGVVVLCDGVFQSQPAVSHAEICAAIDAGWQVWGVSSLGAIRAHELRNEGMRGFGWVYQQFGRQADFADDEMCLLHFPEPPWFPVSEALVNLRYALARRGPALGIPEASAVRLLRALREIWFGDRTEQAIRQLLDADPQIAAASADRLLTWLASHRVKTLDLARLMSRRPWLQPLQRSRR